MMFLSIANAVDEDTESFAEDKADPSFCAEEEKPPAEKKRYKRYEFNSL